MPSVQYNESLYRTGFRPQGTNPWGAAHMDGVGLSGPIRHGWDSFGPWMLRGLSSPRGGERLHGLGAAAPFIPSGSIFTYKGIWTSVFNTGQGYQQKGDPQSIVDGVVAALNQDGQITVISAPNNLNAGFWGSVEATLGAQKSFNVQLVCQVTNDVGFSSVNDIISIIRHFVYLASSLFPAGGESISKLQIPSDPNAADQGVNYQAAGLLNPGGFNLNPPGAGTGAPDDAGGKPQDWSSWIQDNFGTIALLAGALFVLPPLVKRIF